MPELPKSDNWIYSKINAAAQSLSREETEAYQLARLRETIDRCREKSPFYRRHLKGFSGGDLTSLQCLADLPFTTAQDIADDSLQFLCVSQDDIKRVVTLQTSGTTDNPKRLYFTQEDLKLTIDYFARAMSSFVHAGEKVLILLPGEKPDSVGDLIARGLERIQVKGLIHGPVRDPAQTAQEINAHKPACLIGIPTQVLWLARTQDIPKGIIRNIILTTDYVPVAIVRAVEEVWGCRVFSHYGMTETGLGGGVECMAQAGYHLREADLHFEIIDPDTGLPKPEGESGEIVFTTLTRKGMPLIRYRTGDLSRFLPEPCRCGTILKRLERVRGRLGNRVQLGADMLRMADLDEALFPIPALLNYQAAVTQKNQSPLLQITLCAETADRTSRILSQAREALQQIPAIRKAAAANLEIEVDFSKTNWHTTGVEKRMLQRQRISHEQTGKTDR
ncbi:MAG: AMP-binding protein [Desulfobacterales bacterium]